MQTNLTSCFQDLKLTPDDFPGKLMEVAEVCGIGDAYLLLTKLAGLDLYVPGKGLKALIHDQIHKTFTGTNTLSLAVKFGLDSSEVKAIAASSSRPEIPYNSAHMRYVVAECGKEVALRLMQNFPNEWVRIPKSGIDILRKKYILKYFNGSNRIELALKLNVTERYVRKVISESYQVRTEQLSLFD